MVRRDSGHTARRRRLLRIGSLAALLVAGPAIAVGCSDDDSEPWTPGDGGSGAGSSSSLVAALDPKLAVGVGEEKDGKVVGAYLIDCQVAEAGPRASKKGEAERLWGVSEGLVGEKFQW